MSKANTARKSYAEQGLEDIQTDMIDTATLQNPEEPEDEMVNVGGLEPIAGYYQIKAPTKEGKTPVHLFKEEGVINGTYERVWEKDAKSKDGRKFKAYTYIVRFASDGQLYGLSGPGLSKGFQALEPGPKSKVQVTYKGTNEGKDGVTYHNFIIRGNKLKAS
jgi:hypothetical protein